MKNKKKIICILGVLVVLVFSILLIPNIIQKGTKNKITIKNDNYAAANKHLTSDMQQLLLNMGNGYNIGNSYDSQNALSYNPLPSGSDGLKKYFEFVKKSGFSSIRIPMSQWHKITNTTNNTIDSAWLDTLENVVDTALAADLYVIIDPVMLESTGYCEGVTGGCRVTANPAQYESSKKYLTDVWKQVGERFKNKSLKLLFEGFNEIIDSTLSNPYFPTTCKTDGTNDSCAIANKLNKDFVDTVRAQGGNNAQRYLVCNAYNADPTWQEETGSMYYYKVPNNDKKVILGIHYYAVQDWLAKTIKHKYLDQGIPVILGEYGSHNVSTSCPSRNPTTSEVTTRANNLTYIKQQFDSFGMPTFLWDDSGCMKVMVTRANADASKLTDSNGAAWDYNYPIVKSVTSTGPNRAVTSVKGVSLTPSTLNLKVGETGTLTATVTPSNATDTGVIWKSSNPEVATINYGTVTAKSNGTTVITVTTYDGDFVASSTVTVGDGSTPSTVAVSSVSLDKTTASLKVGDSTTLTATINPSNATNKNVTWKTSNGNVATVSNGKITAVGEGSAVITVTTEDGNKTATCSVTVKKVSTPTTVAVSSVSLDKTSVSLNVGNTTILTATVNPSNATNKNVTWKTSNEKVATVSNGKITAIGEGIAVITVTTEDGNKTATCSVTVTKKSTSTTVPVSTVGLDKTAVNLNVGDSTTITAIVSPTNATNKNVTWKTSNGNVATVSNGKITAVGEGTAVITVTTEDGNKTATCSVTVTKKSTVSDDCGAYITYSVTNETTSPVVAIINFKNKQCKADQSTYTFEKNGKYTFKYTNANNEEDEILAEVNWIKPGNTGNTNVVENPNTFSAYFEIIGFVLILLLGTAVTVIYNKKIRQK